ncbi:MAG: magnesium transporter, partial [Pseudomonadota bacterium]
MSDTASEPDEPARDDEDVYALDTNAVAQIMYAVDAGDQELLKSELEPLHAADIADLLEQITAFDRRRLILLLGEGFDGDILSELDEGLREEVLELLKPEVLADTLRELDSDDVVDLLEDLDDEQQEVILDALEDSDRVAAENALAYPEESAGRMMQREV